MSIYHGHGSGRDPGDDSPQGDRLRRLAAGWSSAGHRLLGSCRCHECGRDFVSIHRDRQAHRPRIAGRRSVSRRGHRRLERSSRHSNLTRASTICDSSRTIQGRGRTRPEKRPRKLWVVTLHGNATMYSRSGPNGTRFSIASRSRAPCRGQRRGQIRPAEPASSQKRASSRVGSGAGTRTWTEDLLLTKQAGFDACHVVADTIVKPPQGPPWIRPDNHPPS